MTSRDEQELWDIADRYVNAGHYDDAILIYSDLLRRNPSGRAFAMRAYCLYQLGQFMAAESDFTRALSLESSAINTLYMRGRARTQLDDHLGALKDFKAVLERNPQDDQALTQIAIIYECDGDAEAARSAYVSALAINAGNHLAREGLQRLT